MLKDHFLNSLMCWGSGLSVVAGGAAKPEAPGKEHNICRREPSSDRGHSGSKRVRRAPAALLSLSLYCLSPDRYNHENCMAAHGN